MPKPIASEFRQTKAIIERVINGYASIVAYQATFRSFFGTRSESKKEQNGNESFQDTRFKYKRHFLNITFSIKYRKYLTEIHLCDIKTP